MRGLRAALIAVLAVAGLAAPTNAAPCRADRIELRGPWGQAAFAVEVADTDALRAKGLMNRPSMPMGAGMLFVYPQPTEARFWMRNTLIPLDMIFADPAGRVQKVHAMAQPLDETVINGGTGISFVLEINGGLAGRLGITAGTEMRHPATSGPGAAWPCD